MRSAATADAGAIAVSRYAAAGALSLVSRVDVSDTDATLLPLPLLSLLLHCLDAATVTVAAAAAAAATALDTVPTLALA